MIWSQISGIHNQAVYTYTSTHMKRLIALAVVIFGARAIGVFAGEPISQVIAPPLPPEYFKPNEFDIGAFGTYAKRVDSDYVGKLHAWRGMDFTWLECGCRYARYG
jgi:hypothetical protein